MTLETKISLKHPSLSNWTVVIERLSSEPNQAYQTITKKELSLPNHNKKRAKPTKQNLPTGT